MLQDRPEDFPPSEDALVVRAGEMKPNGLRAALKKCLTHAVLGLSTVGDATFRPTWKVPHYTLVLLDSRPETIETLRQAFGEPRPNPNPDRLEQN